MLIFTELKLNSIARLAYALVCLLAFLTAHGSVRYLTDTAGGLTDTLDYDAFGNLLATSGATPVTRLFTGEEFDAELDGFPLPCAEENRPGGDDLERLATSFIGQVRRGEAPDTSGMASAHPELAADLAELLPIAEALEQWKAQKEAECLKQNRLSEFSITRLGDCEIVREIGRGGMGVVFEARQGPFERRVAVKMLPWRFGEALPKWKERFHQEAQTIARLRHPNIVPVYTFGEHEGYCYYVMQLVEGLSLDRVLAGLSDPSALPPAGALLAKRLNADHWPSMARIAAQVSLALEHAHASGVLHNDIKPANLLLDSSGQILVTDFCAHRLRTDFEEQTERGSGTYRYLAPERLYGPGDVRSDVYSLGVTLYELLTRKPAFAGKDREELLERIAHAQILPPRKIRPEIPWPLEAIVEKSMSFSPDERYSSVREFRRDLMRFLHGEPISLPRPNPIRRFVRWCQDHWRRPAQTD